MGKSGKGNPPKNQEIIEMNEVAVVSQNQVSAPQTPKKEFFALSPRDQVNHATEIANVLSSIIEKQNLFSMISGKKYIKAEGWQTLGTFLGVMPREKYVKRHDDGSYEAYIEIVKFNDGSVVGGASALCSRKENRWRNADDYAVRSMAVTRAMGKAFRVGFSWIVTLAGYEPTNQEEMPETIDVASHAVPPPPQAKPAQAPSLYDPHNKTHQDVLIKILTAQKVPEELWDKIGFEMSGKPSSMMPQIIKNVLDSQPQ